MFFFYHNILKMTDQETEKLNKCPMLEKWEMEMIKTSTWTLQCLASQLAQVLNMGIDNEFVMTCLVKSKSLLMNG